MKYPQLVSMPSAVSDWLEEQLDARGIDAVVYTRYVLSLLQHHHSQDEDLGELEQEFRQQQQQHAKESSAGGKHPSGRGGGGSANKRLRRSWFQHVVRVAADVDVEQLRRSAAVEALMSAAEQKCGIESLVDELCEKLKHFESLDQTESKPPSTESNKNSPIKTISPADLARKYYAAFPPLSNNKSSTKLIEQLIPQICTQNNSILQKRKHNRRPNHTSNHSFSSKDKTARVDMKSRSGNKQRLFLSKRDFGFARNMEKSDTSDWDMYFLNNRMGDEGYSTSDTTEEDAAAAATTGKKIDEAHLAKLVAKFDQRIEALWSTEENEPNDYHDLPFDFEDLLASPIKNVEIYGSNKRVQSAAKSFIQCGTNITSSIWTECADEQSMYDSMSFSNLYDESVLGDQFNSLSVAAAVDDDNFNKFGIKNNFTSLPWEIFPSNFNNNKKWSDAEEKRNVVNRAVNDSLATLNHNKEASCFKEVVPKQALGLTSYEPLETKLDDVPADETKEEEDLLTSTRTHFRPIKQDTHETATHVAPHHYADGTTFQIRSSLEHINYRRSESGTLYLESGFDSPKKYQEYRLNCDDDTFVLKFNVRQNEKCCQTDLDADGAVDADDDDADDPVDADDAVDADVESGSSQSHSPLEVPAKKRVLCDPEEFFFPGDEELLSDTVDGGAECSCASRGRVKLATSLEPLFNASTEACSLHGRDSTVAEINWPEAGSTSWRKCDKCNNNWSTVWPKPDTNHLSVWGSAQKSDSSAWQQIWSSSEELCRTCLGVPAGSGPPPGRSLEYFKLREELSEDGEQLLSDLSCLQRVYMEQLPTSEVTCDLNSLPTTAAATTTTATTIQTQDPVVPAKLFGIIGERKRRHSSSQRSCEPIAATVARNSWTNSSCLQMRCLFTPPLLRPVTL